MFYRLKVEIKADHEYTGARIDVVIDSFTTDFRIQSLVLSNDKRILYRSIYACTLLIIEEFIECISQRDVVHAHERSILNVIAGTVLSVLEISAAGRGQTIFQESGLVIHIGAFVCLTVGLHIIVNIVTEAAAQSK